MEVFLLSLALGTIASNVFIRGATTASAMGDHNEAP